MKSVVWGMEIIHTAVLGTAVCGTGFENVTLGICSVFVAVMMS